jgi:hypothetical protein
MFSMNLTRASRFLLALALLAVWQGALLHPLQHVDAKGAFVHVPGEHAPKLPGDKNTQNPLCDAIAAVAACVSGSAKIAVGAVPGVESIQPREIVALFGAPQPAYRSQAPPSLL